MSKANTNRTRPGYRRGYQKGRPAVTRTRPGHRRGCQKGKPTVTRGESRSRGTSHQVGGNANTNRTRPGHQREYQQGRPTITRSESRNRGTSHPVGRTTKAREDGPRVRTREVPSVGSESIHRDGGYIRRGRGRSHGHGIGRERVRGGAGGGKRRTQGSDFGRETDVGLAAACELLLRSHELHREVLVLQEPLTSQRFECGSFA